MVTCYSLIFLAVGTSLNALQLMFENREADISHDLSFCESERHTVTPTEYHLSDVRRINDDACAAFKAELAQFPAMSQNGYLHNCVLTNMKGKRSRPIN